MIQRGTGDTEDLLSLRGVAEAYAAAVDDRDPVALAACLAPGFEMDVPAALNPDGVARVHTDPAAIVATLTSFVRTRHVIDRVRATVDVERQRATGNTLCQAHHLYRKRDGSVRDYHAFLRYHDTFALLESRWLLAARRLELEWSIDVAVTLPDAPASE